MAKAIAKASASVPAQKPPQDMPHTVKLLVADPMTATGEASPSEWQLPDNIKVEAALLDEGKRYIESKLKPCGDGAVAEVLAPMMLTTHRRNDEVLSIDQASATLAAELGEYQRLLRHIPRDLLQKAADDHILVNHSKFFPMPAELLALATPELERRKRQQIRIGRLIDAQKAPKPKDATPPWQRQDMNPEERKQWGITRLRELIELKRKRGGIALNGIDALERELAKLEGRTVTITLESLGPELSGNSATAVIEDEHAPQGAVEELSQRDAIAGSGYLDTSWKRPEPPPMPPQPTRPPAKVEELPDEIPT